MTDKRDSIVHGSHAAALAVAEQYEALISEWPVAHTRHHVAAPCTGQMGQEKGG